MTPGVKLIFPRFVLSDVNSCPTCAVSVEPMSCQCNCAELIAPEALAATVVVGGGGGVQRCVFSVTLTGAGLLEVNCLNHAKALYTKAE